MTYFPRQPVRCWGCQRQFTPPPPRPTGRRNLAPAPLQVNLGSGNVYVPDGVKPPSPAEALQPVTTPRPAPDARCLGNCQPLVGGMQGALFPGPSAMAGASGGPPGMSSQCGNALMGSGSAAAAVCEHLDAAGQQLVQWAMSHPEEALLACGMVPVVGLPCNLVLAGIAASRGDSAGVMLSLLAAGIDLVALTPPGADAEALINETRLSRTAFSRSGVNSGIRSTSDWERRVRHLRTEDGKRADGVAELQRSLGGEPTERGRGVSTSAP
jgi:hypothetical protein